MSFTTFFTDKRITRKDAFYNEVNILIDWNEIEKIINKHYTVGQDITGRSAYPGLLLFKMLLLGMWNGLSDYGVEDLVNDSLSANRFCGLTIEDSVPDNSVLSRFRTHLTKKKVFDKLLSEINMQLEKKQVMIKTVVKVDASITPTPRKPKGKKTYELIDNGTVEQYHKSSVDKDAAWFKKANKLYYGYKKHILTDDNGLVVDVTTTPANTHDSKELQKLIIQSKLQKGTQVQADKAYKSKEHDDFIHKLSLHNGIQHRATKNNPLTKEQKQHNKQVAKTRYMVERTFGSIKRWFNSTEARYIGKEKTHTQHLLEAIAYNLKRMPKLYYQHNAG